MLKKPILNILIVTLLLTLIIHPAKAASNFIDTKNDSWYSAYVDNLVELGIINGFPDGTFRPEDTLNADQFIKMTVIALGHDPGNGPIYWASPYIEYAASIGLLEDSEIYDYKEPLSRGEIVCMLSKALDYLHENISIETCGLYDLYGYTPEKYIACVLKTYNAGIIEGYPDYTFRYEKYINRAEACAVIHKLVTPINRRERQITSLTPVPVCYSYIEDQITKKINEYEGNNGCFFMNEIISKNGAVLSTLFNRNINKNIMESIKLLYDNISFPVIDYISLMQNNVIQIDCFSEQRLSHNKEYAKFSINFYDRPTGYSESQWGYDTMFVKLEINSLSNDGLLNKETGLPDVYYEYKIKALMRLLFGIEKGDFFSQLILDKYTLYSTYKAGNIPVSNELLDFEGIKMVFFCEGDGRKLCFTFSED